MFDPITLDFPDHFETPRLLIRAPRIGDERHVHAAVHASWEQLSPWMPWAKIRPTWEESAATNQRGIENWAARSDLRLLLFLKSSGELTGSSGLHRIDWEVPRFEIGYWQRTKFCGQGLMTEAVEGIATFAFQILGANRVEIRCDAHNEASRRVAERAGFAWEATLHHNLRSNDGELRDTLIFARFPEGEV